MDTIVVLSLVVLATSLAIALVSCCNRQIGQTAALHRRLAEQNEHLLKLSEVEFVRQHLRQTGVGPYLLSASVAERVKNDLQTIMDLLQCDEETAVQYLIRGTAHGPEQTADSAGRQ